jgi:hypothetical protein
MVQRAATISSDDGNQRSVASTGNFPVDARQNGTDEQHGNYLFDGHATRVRWRIGVFRGVMERSMEVKSESLHDGLQVDLNISSVRNHATVPNQFFRISIAARRLCDSRPAGDRPELDWTRHLARR